MQLSSGKLPPMVSFLSQFMINSFGYSFLGEKPFSDHNICVGLKRFVQFLQAGHRLPQPYGLSDSM